MIDPQIQKTAIHWFVRSRSDDFSSDEKNSFDDWLAENESHRAAFDQVAARWASTAGLDEARRRVQPLRSERGVTPPRWRWAVALAASVAVIALSLLFMTEDATLRYQTAVGEQRRILLEDGSSLHLNTDSVVDISFNDQLRKVMLLQGEVLCDVAHDPDLPFVVAAGAAEFQALGTVFSVYRAEGATKVSVLEGRVAVNSQPAENLDDQPQSPVIERGEAFVMDTASPKTRDRGIVTPMQIIPSWDKGLLVFSDTPLDEVVEEINRYFPRKIQLGPEVRPFLVTGTFKLRDQDVLLTTLAQSYGLGVVSGDDASLLVNERN